jgi:hypothetical protein
VQEIFKLFYELTTTFGKVFTKHRIQPLFTSAMENGSVRLIQPVDEGVQKVFLVRSKVLPVQICGIYAACEKPVLQNHIKDLILNVTLQQGGWDLKHIPILLFTFKEGGKLTVVNEDMIAVIHSLVVHPATPVRTTITQLLTVMVSFYSSSEITINSWKVWMQKQFLPKCYP